MRTRGSTIRLKAEAVRAIAARRNQTLDDLARAVRIDRRRFYRLLSGRVSPSPKTRARICRALKVDFIEIFEIADERGLDVAAAGREPSHG